MIMRNPYKIELGEKLSLEHMVKAVALPGYTITAGVQVSRWCKDADPESHKGMLYYIRDGILTEVFIKLPMYALILGEMYNTAKAVVDNIQ